MADDPNALPPAQQDTDNPPPPAQPSAQPQQAQTQQQLTDVSFMSDTPAPAKGNAPSLLDYGKQLYRGFGDIDSGLLSAASWTARQLNASPDTVKFFEDARSRMDEHNQQVFNSMTPAGQAAATASLFGSEGPSVGDVGLLHYALMNGASFVPDGILAVATDGIASPLGARIAGTVGAGIARAAATGGAFGAIQLGDAYHEFVKDVDATPDEQYRAQNPAYAHMRDNGMSEYETKAAIVKQGMTQLGALQFGIGAITGAGAGHLLTSGAMGGAGRGLLARLGLGALQGGIDLGAQSGGGNAASQLTSQGAGLQKDFDPGQLASSFASGALGGVILGGAGGVFHPGPEAAHPAPDHEETAETGASTTGVAPDVGAALNTQLEMPLNQAAPGRVPGSPQGELFRGIDQAQTQPAAAQAAEPQAAPPAPAQAPQAATASPPAAAGPAPNTVSQTVPEPRADLIAQLKAVGDPDNPKDAAFIPAGGMAFTKSIRDAIPANAQVVARPGVGRLITTNADKADTFKNAKTLGDDDMADLLGYPESKSQVAAAGGPTTVVQGRDAQGNVVHESAASPEGVPAAVQAAQAVAPEVHQVTPEEALARRQEQQPTPVDDAAEKAAAPTPAQAEAGNYQKGHVKIGGLDISIETPKGGVRKGVGPDGPWETTMPAHYGYVKRTTGADGDHVDITLGPKAHEAEKHPVYVFDQKDPASGKFDEHKAYAGFERPTEAIDAYDASFSDGSGASRRAEVTQMPFDQFKDWAQNGDTTKALKYKPTVSDQLKAKRAAAKAQMAKPGEAQRGTVATGESDKAPIAETAPRTHDEVMQDLRDAVDASKSTVVPLQKGADIARVVNQVMRELATHLRTAKTEGDIHEAVAKWARSSTDPMPGTRTRRIEIGDNVLRRLTGKTVDELSGRAQRLTQEVAREPRPPAVYESEGAARKAEVESAHAREQDQAREDATTVVEGSEGVTQAYEGEGRPEPQKVVDKLPWWLDRVLNGHMSVQEADQAYGRGSKTKPRKYPTFAHYLDERISQAEDPTLIGKLRDMLTKESKKSDQAKSAESVQLERLLDQTGKEFANKLRDLKGELDPVGEAADAADPVTQAAKKIEALPNAPQTLRAMSAYQNTLLARAERARVTGEGLLKTEADFARDAAESAKIRADILKQYGVTEDDVSAVNKGLSAIPGDRLNDRVNDHLDDKYHQPAKRSHADVMADLKARNAARKAGTPLARTDRSYAATVNDSRLSRVVDDMLGDGKPHDLSDYLNAIAKDDLIGQEAPAMAALARRMAPLVRFADVTPDTTMREAGMYYPNQNLPGVGRIRLNPDSRQSHLETVVHEGLHSITSHYIDSLSAGHADRQLLEAMHEELSDAADAAAERGRLTPAAVEDIHYALTNMHEMHTMLMSNPHLQQLAADHVPSPQFRMRMQGLGYPLQAAKSVWTAFTAFVRKALGLKGVPSQSDASLMDHILRPAQDITERAAAYNQRGNLQTLTDVASHAMPDFRGRARDALDRVDPAGLGDRGRRALLAGATTDGIVKWNKDILPQLEAYRAATESVAARSTKFHDDYADTVANLIKSSQGPERDKLAQLMNDATIANVQLGKGADNSHLSNTDALTRLQGRFSALSRDTQRTYESMRDYYAKTYREERDAQLSGMIKTFLPDATDVQRKAITEAARTKRGLESMVTDQADDVVKSFGTDWASHRTLVRGIGQVHGMGFVQGDYFPLRRFGDYVVRYGSKENEDYGVEMFEKRSEAEARRAELVKQGADDVSQVLDKRTSKLRSMMPSTTVANDMMAAMMKRSDLAEHADDARNLLNSVLLQHATHSERARQSMRRRGIAGASTEIEKVLAKDFLSTSSRIGYLENGPARLSAISDMRRHADGLEGPGQQIRAQSVIHELEQRMPSGDDASGFLTGAARKFSTLGFVQSLMSPSHMLTSSIEAHMNSTALLGARHGGMRAALALTKALKDVTPTLLGKGAKNTLAAMGKGLKASDWNLSHVARDRLIAAGANRANMMDLFNRLNGAGLIDHTMVREMQRIAGGYTTDVGKWWGRFMDLNAAGAHAVDVANKTAIAKAAYDLELKKTGSHDAAARYAVDTARQAMPNYNLANKARITTDKGPLGGFAGPLTQFKQYGIHMYSVMGNLVKASIHGASREERMEARKAFAGILATHAMMAGALALPMTGDALRWIGGAYDFITGADKPHDYENDVRSWITAAFGPELGEIIARGVPHAAGIDIHRRVGLNNLLEPPELNSFDKKGFAEAVASAMTGAAGEDATVMAGGMSKILHGDIVGGLKDLVPRVIRDPMKAMGLADKGVTDSKGKTILAPEKIGTGGVMAQALGFQPAKVSEFREARFATLEAREEAASARSQLVQGWLKAAPDDRAAAHDQIREYNQAHPEARITMEQLLQARQRDKTTSKRQVDLYGLRVPRNQARSLSSAGSFANTQ